MQVVDALAGLGAHIRHDSMTVCDAFGFGVLEVVQQTTYRVATHV